MEKLVTKLLMVRCPYQAAEAFGFRLAAGPAGMRTRTRARAINKKDTRKTRQNTPVYWPKLELFNYCSVGLDTLKTVPISFFQFLPP